VALVSVSREKEGRVDGNKSMCGEWTELQRNQPCFHACSCVKAFADSNRKIHAGTRRFFSSSSAKEDVVDVGTTRLNRLLPGGFDE